MTRSGAPTLLHGKPGLAGKAGARELVERVVQELGGWEICVLPRCAVYYNGNHPPHLKAGSVQGRSLLESVIEWG